jgi:cephalosporin-C deacetylase-like acetyl esterase
MYRLSLLLVLTTALSAPAQKESPRPGDAAAEKYLKQRTAQVQGRFLDGAKTLKEWQARRPRLRREYLDMLGLWPKPEKTPLKVAITGTVDRDSVLIDKLHFQSKPGLYVTGNLYRPAKPDKKKLPAILYVCGHSGRGRDGNKTAFQDHGMWFARHGYVCLVIDTLQLGEVKGLHHGTYNLNRWWWHSLAYTPAGVECWNGIRAIDYLVSRPDVDAEKIGVTGISGGGASTIWIAAADPRVKVAVPVSGMSDLESYVSNKVINGHCDCMFLVNFHAWEWTTIAALIAPRPMLFANSDNDRIFPMDGNRRIIARLRQLYKLYGKPDRVDDYVSEGGHDYRPDLRLAVFRWINKHLKGDTTAIKDADDKPLPGKELRVFPEDRDLPKDALNATIDETFIARGKPGLPQKGKFAQWKKGLVAKLRAGPFRGLTRQEQESLPIQVRRVERGDGNVRGTLIVLGENDPGDRIPDWARPHLTKGPADALLPRGTGPLAWTRKSPPNYVERAHALLGETVDTGRARDVLDTVRKGRGPGGIRVIGRGQPGILAAYAAVFNPRIDEVVVIDPPASHKDGPHFLGVLRILDVPDALGLLAPRPLTLVGAKDKAFERTAKLYEAAGAKEKLTRK